MNPDNTFSASWSNRSVLLVKLLYVCSIAKQDGPENSQVKEVKEVLEAADCSRKSIKVPMKAH
jgi:hypothetical protein